jgi:CRP-like cAMP-binding protein
LSIFPGNAILGSLPSDELERLSPFLKTVTLKSGQRISNVDEPLTHIWFPENGAVSRLVHLLTGETVEAGIVGNDGVIGLPLALGSSDGVGICRVHVDGSARVMAAADFDEHVRRRGGPLMDALLLYTNLYIGILGQLTACHCLHRIEQRLSRCILELDDYGDGGEIRVTHDTLSEFLGVHRPSITYALQALAHTGAISSERRRIVITDRTLLMEHGCECYTVIRATTARELARMRAAA